MWSASHTVRPSLPLPPAVLRRRPAPHPLRGPDDGARTLPESSTRNAIERGAASGVPAQFAGAALASDEGGSPLELDLPIGLYDASNCLLAGSWPPKTPPCLNGHSGQRPHIISRRATKMLGNSRRRRRPWLNIPANSEHESVSYIHRPRGGDSEGQSAFWSVWQHWSRRIA